MGGRDPWLGGCQKRALIKIANGILAFDAGAHGVRRVHATACACAGTSILLNILEHLLRRVTSFFCALERVVGIGAEGLVGGADVDRLLERFRVSRLYGATVDHEGGTVVARESHDDTGHVLVTTGNGDAGIVVLGAGDGFEGVCDELAGLEGEAHS